VTSGREHEHSASTTCSLPAWSSYPSLYAWTEPPSFPSLTPIPPAPSLSLSSPPRQGTNGETSSRHRRPLHGAAALVHPPTS
jgi:hypothetical protein